MTEFMRRLILEPLANGNAAPVGELIFDVDDVGVRHAI
ncbi:MAG: hypothetical protein JWP92_1567 [Caulobacter sp.]|nr:hypothetical protein [Caulobacter sp.]